MTQLYIPDSSKVARKVGVGSLELPPGVKHSRTSGPLGRDVITTGQVVAHTFTFKYTYPDGSVRRQRVAVTADESMSQAQIEDMVAGAYERFLVECKTKNSARTPTRAERLEVAEALREFRAKAKKRSESTNKKVYY